ncbi:MAG: nonstructural protein [Microvirus sp.]|nr:MAG: nonstructural protein [Microvirus sp.]
MQIVAIRDIKADLFAQPAFTSSLGASIRDFGDRCNKPDENNLLYLHPEDFELYHLGTYNDDNAKFTLLDQPKQIATGGNYKGANK